MPSLLCAVALSAAVGCGRIGVEVQISAQEGADAASDEGDEDLDASAPDVELDDASVEDEASALDADSTQLDSASALDGAGSNAMSTLDGASGDATSAADVGLCATNAGAYVPDASCGVGYCRLHNTPSRCANGTEIACIPAAPRSAGDSSCDGVDDDCDGYVDEDYVAASTSCGRGVCARSGLSRCMNGALRDSCVAAEPATSRDDTTALGNGLDDDCDGQVDEDIPGCDTTPRAFEAGHHTDLAVPPGCGRVTVRLWGAGGASGGDLGVDAAGDGGAGGYASLTTPINGPLSLLIGEGGASGCDAAGVNAGSANYSGGSGGSAEGEPGADGMVPQGGAGGISSAGYAGGRGHFGGGGGGQGSGGLGASGNGGGGGAASVFIMNGMRLVVAGGGGGGGGAQSVSIFGTFLDVGGNGGGGCAGIGQVESSSGGGGGGGGACDGFATHLGTGVTPAFSEDVPAGRARGAAGGCAAGGAGYAIVTFSR